MNTCSYMSVTNTVALLKLISSETRFKIFTILARPAKNTVCVKEIARHIGKTHSATSHQLSKLEEKGFVQGSRCGQTICYQLTHTPEATLLKKIVKHCQNST